jgi:hypothetical protein
MGHPFFVRRRRGATAAILLILFLLASGFSFSEHEAREAAQEAAQVSSRDDEIARLLATPCARKLKNRRIATLIGEIHDQGRARRTAGDDGPLFEEINLRMRRLGLQTISPETIRAQVAQAEIQAFLNNDPDAAIQAAGRLQADFFLRGLIQARTRVNPVVRVNEVFVTLTLTLVDRKGRPISHVSATADSFAGQDTLAAALALVQEQADLLVARLYSDYCRQVP